jgi:hypothetical protein
MSVSGLVAKIRFTGLCEFHQQTPPIELAINSACPVSIIYHTPAFTANSINTLGKLRRHGNTRIVIVGTNSGGPGRVHSTN